MLTLSSDIHATDFHVYDVFHRFKGMVDPLMVYSHLLGPESGLAQGPGPGRIF